MRRRLALAAWRLPVLLLAGTGCEGGGSRPFEVVECLQAGVSAVALNEPLVIRFSAPVDPLSLHPGSLAIETVDGVPALGSLRAVGRRVQFTPRSVLAADLQDGGYRPGAEYRVLVSGFPDLAALRSTDGRVLARSVRFGFRAADHDDPSAFLDPVPGEAPLPDWRTDVSLSLGEPLTVRFSEPVRPDLLGAIRVLEMGADDELRVLEVHCRLLENETTALVEMKAEWSPGAGIVIDLAEGIMDYSGRRVPLPLRRVRVWVQDP